jgi:hypothetical protein
MAVAFELGAEVGRAPILPDDGVVDRFTRAAVPDEGGFALVGDADSCEVALGDVARPQRLLRRRKLAGPDVTWIVLDPAALRIDLGELALGGGMDVAGAIKEDGPRAGGALVECEDVAGSGQGLVVSG